jgi:ABC-type glycerol-3-phosphate transport system substrate-binding protein
MRTLLKVFVWAIILGSSIWAFFIYKPEEPPPGKTVVTFSVWGGVAERKGWEALARDFERKHPSLVVDLQLVPLKYNEKILSLLAANIAPDVFSVKAEDMIPKGVLLPIDDFLAHDTSFHPEDFASQIWQLGYFYGHYYDIPATAAPLALFYNVKHFKEAGLPTPNEYAAEGKWNWDTFLSCCKKLTKRDEKGDVTRWAYRVYADYIIWMYIAANGGKPFTDDWKHCNFDDPKVYEALQRLADLSLVDSVAPPIVAEEQAGVLSSWMEFKRGNVSMMDSGPWMIGRLKGMEDEYDVAPPPIEPGGRPINSLGNVTGIWVKCKHPAAAYAWQSYLWTEDARVIWAKLGFDIPMLKSLVVHKEKWLDAATAPKHFDVLYEIVDEALKPPYSVTPRIPQKVINFIYRSVWESVRLGTKSARQALKDVEPEVERMLNEAS